MSFEAKLEIVKDVLNYSHSSRGEYLFHCPYCEHHNPKMSVNIEKNVYKCWVCDARGMDIWRVIRRFGDVQDKRKWRTITNCIDASEQSIYDLLFGTTDTEEIEQLSLPEEFVSLVNRNLPPSAAPALRYLRSRGITRQDIVQWKMGFCSRGEFEGRIIFPSFSASGEVNYYVARSYTGDWMKYKNPSTSKDIVFNEIFVDWREKVFLVEGIFDAVATGTNSVPILGSTLSEHSNLFRKLIENDSAVYLALDNDAEKKTMKIASSLSRHGIEVFKVDTSGYDDIATMPKKMLDKRIKDVTMITSEDVLRRTIRTIGV